jgi:F-type H+-transporting ATPase subunit epsilon
MKTYKLTVSSPDGNVFSGECVKFDARGTEGEFAIMAGHVPFVTSVVKGKCVITLEDGSRLNAVTEGGLITVGTDKVNFISGSFKITDRE